MEDKINFKQPQLHFMDLTKLTLQEIDQLIARTRKEKVLEHHDAYVSALAPEVTELRQKLMEADRLFLAPLLKLREEKILEEEIKKALEENPLIKEVEKEVTGKSEATAKPNVSAPSVSTRRNHYLLPLLKKAMAARCHTWLVGPAGSGKSTLAANAAAELKMPYAALSVCSQTTKTDFLGYLDAHGVYRSTSFREIYENGGIFCLDEVDNGNANVLAVLNSSLSGDETLFPDKVVKKHKNFVVVSCANTFGLGSSISYVGRTQIDAATLDRFFFVEMPYDDGLEAHVAGFPGVASPKWNDGAGKVPTVESWLATVQKVRDAVAELGAKAIISPRATYNGIALIKQGVPQQFLEKGLLYKSLSAETVAKIRQA
jgi:cobaltochelatase CobS